MLFLAATLITSTMPTMPRDAISDARYAADDFGAAHLNHSLIYDFAGPDAPAKRF